MSSVGLPDRGPELRLGTFRGKCYVAQLRRHKTGWENPRGKRRAGARGKHRTSAITCAHQRTVRTRRAARAIVAGVMAGAAVPRGRHTRRRRHGEEWTWQAHHQDKNEGDETTIHEGECIARAGRCGHCENPLRREFHERNTLRRGHATAKAAARRWRSGCVQLLPSCTA